MESQAHCQLSHHEINGMMSALKSECLIAWQSWRGHLRGDDYGGDLSNWLLLQIIGEKTFRIAGTAFLGTWRCVSPGVVQGMEGKRKRWIWERLVAYLICSSPELIL